MSTFGIPRDTVRAQRGGKIRANTRKRLRERRRRLLEEHPERRATRPRRIRTEAQVEKW